MAITFPFDLLANWPGWSTDYDLLRREEQSRTAAGVTYVKDFGEPLWRASYITRSLKPNELDYWRARVEALDGGQQLFLAYPLSRCAPIRYPNNTWPTTNGFNGGNATVGSIQSNRKELSITGLGGGFVVSVGDMMRIGTRNLHRVIAGGTANSGGTASGIEVRPHLWPETGGGDNVSFRKPYCRMTIVPGSVQSSADPATGRGTLRFDAVEAR